MHSVPVVITGLGLCTPLGDSAAATWEALLAGKFITEHSQAAGEFDRPRVCALARRAAREAVANAGWTAEEVGEAGLVVGTSKGPVEQWLEGIVAPAGLAEVALDVASDLQLGDAPRLTLSAACASGLHALIRGAMLLAEGTPRVIVVAAESSLHPLFLGSFQRLGVLAPKEIGCRPFDEDRAGFLVSEASAAVCLEREGQGVRVERFAMGGDAVHLTAGDPTGRTLRRLLASVIDGRAVDLIHAHGTGTVANDATELAAIESVLTSVPPSSVTPMGSVESSLRVYDSPQSSVLLFSHKAALGHTLGAAGLISVVLNCMSHLKGAILPNVRTTRPLEMKGVQLSGEAVRRAVQRSVVVASGFGGASAVVSLVSSEGE